MADKKEVIVIDDQQPQPQQPRKKRGRKPGGKTYVNKLGMMIYRHDDDRIPAGFKELVTKPERDFRYAKKIEKLENENKKLRREVLELQRRMDENNPDHDSSDDGGDHESDQDY